MPDLPAPLTPPECDLRGMPYMALDLVRLFDSDLYALSSGDEFKAAMTLWGKSFYQLPGGSLPDDDRLLAYLSGAKRWQAVKKMALRGWMKCADGRLYHPTVAQKAVEAWSFRLARRARTEAARAARQVQIQSEEGGRGYGRKKTSCIVTNNITDTAPDYVTDIMTESVTESVTELVTDFVADSVTNSVMDHVTEIVTNIATETNRTELKQREQIRTEPRLSDSSGMQAQGEMDEIEVFERFWRLYPRKIGRGQARRAFLAALKKAPAMRILAALQKHSFNPQERFQPHPATWLNDERWLDEQPQQDPVLRAAGVINEAPALHPAWDILK